MLFAKTSARFRWQRNRTFSSVMASSWGTNEMMPSGAVTMRPAMEPARRTMASSGRRLILMRSSAPLSVSDLPSFAMTHSGWLGWTGR